MWISWFLHERRGPEIDRFEQGFDNDMNISAYIRFWIRDCSKTKVHLLNTLN